MESQVVTTPFAEPRNETQDGKRVHLWEPPHRGHYNQRWGITRWYPDVQIQVLTRDDGLEMAWKRSGRFFVFSCNGTCWYDSSLVHNEVFELKRRSGYDTTCPSDEQMELMLEFVRLQSGPHKCGRDQFVSPLHQFSSQCITDFRDVVIVTPIP